MATIPIAGVNSTVPAPFTQPCRYFQSDDWRANSFHCSYSPLYRKSVKISNGNKEKCDFKSWQPGHHPGQPGNLGNLGNLGSTWAQPGLNLAKFQTVNKIILKKVKKNLQSSEHLPYCLIRQSSLLWRRRNE